MSQESTPIIDPQQITYVEFDRLRDDAKAKFISIGHSQDDLLHSGTVDFQIFHDISNIGVFFNQCNSIIGAGCIGVPFAIYESGFIMGICLVLFTAGLTMYSNNTIVRLGVKHNVHHFEDIGMIAFGNFGYYAVCFFQFFLSLGFICADFIIVADTLPVVFAHLLGVHSLRGIDNIPSEEPSLIVKVLTSRVQVTVVIGLFFLLPICLSRGFSNLAKYSILSMCGVILFTLVVTERFLADPSKYNSHSTTSFEYDYIDIHPNLFPALGTIAFAYVCQHQTFLVYESMRERSPVKFRQISTAAVVFSTFIALTFGIFGYLTFLNLTQSDLFLNYKDMGDRLIQFCRLIVALTILLSYPLDFMVARYTLNLIFKKISWDYSAVKEDDKSPSPLLSINQYRVDQIRHVVITFLLLCASMCIALFARTLGDVLSLTGGFSAVIIAYVIPSSAHLILGSTKQNNSKTFFQDSFLPWCTLCFGIVSFVLATGMTLYNIISS